MVFFVEMYDMFDHLPVVFGASRERNLIGKHLRRFDRAPLSSGAVTRRPDGSYYFGFSFWSLH